LKDWRSDYEKTHIIFLAETKEAADLGSTLGAQTLGSNVISETGNVVVALLDDAEGEDREIHSDDAATNGLPLALTSTAGTVAAVALGEEQRHTGRVHDTLLHGEALLVVASGDPEDVSLELIADAVAGNFLAHTAVHEDAELALIIDLDQLLCAIGGEGDVQLHLAGSAEPGGVVVEGRPLGVEEGGSSWIENFRTEFPQWPEASCRGNVDPSAGIAKLIRGELTWQFHSTLLLCTTFTLIVTKSLKREFGLSMIWICFTSIHVIRAASMPSPARESRNMHRTCNPFDPFNHPNCQEQNKSTTVCTQLQLFSTSFILL